MKIYLASSWRNPYHAAALAFLRKLGHDVYDFKNPAEGNTGFSWKQTLDRPIVTAADLHDALRHPRARDGFRHDYHGMRSADVCVLLLPAGNSAHLEAGWFTGKGRPIVVYVPHELREPELMYLLDDPEGAETPLVWSEASLAGYLAGIELLRLAELVLRDLEDPRLDPRSLGIADRSVDLRLGPAHADYKDINIAVEADRAARSELAELRETSARRLRRINELEEQIEQMEFARQCATCALSEVAHAPEPGHGNASEAGNRAAGR